MDPFVFTLAGGFVLDNAEPLVLQVSGRFTESVPRWVHSKEVGIPAQVCQRLIEKQFHVCYFCGFRSKKYQEIVVRHGQEWIPENNKVACIFCAQCLALESVPGMRSGALVHLPEISQNELNYVAKIIYVARISQGESADLARQLLDALQARKQNLDQALSENIPTLVDQLKIGPTHYENVRLMPLDRRIIKEADLEFNQLPQILAYWRSKDGPFGGKPPTKWVTKGFSYYLQLLSAEGNQ